MKKDNLVYIQDVLDACERILSYTDGMTEKNFSEDRLTQDAVIRNIEIIGEASKNLTQNFITLHKEYPYKETTTMRNKLIHEYDYIDYETVWDTVAKDIPSLRNLTEKILGQQTN